MDGKLELVRPKRSRFYTRLPGWQTHLRKTLRFRNHDKYKVALMAEHGELTSFILKNEAERQARDNVNE